MTNIAEMERSVILAPTLKDAMRHLTGGVSVITAGFGDERTGLTVTTAHSLSLDPAVMVVNVNRSSSGYAAIRQNRHFCVNLIADHQQATAERFSGFGGLKGKDRYGGANWTALTTGALALDGALANIDCDLEEVIDRHSHGIFLGLVREVRICNPLNSQLIYQRGAYGVYPAVAPQP